MGVLWSWEYDHDLIYVVIMYKCLNATHPYHNDIIAEYIYSIITEISAESLLHTEHFAKCFISTNSFTTRSSLMKVETIITLIVQLGK